jgi:O-succinylbenzoic acid--CoA ligase
METIVATLAFVELAVPMVLLHPRLTEGERERLTDAVAPTWAIDDLGPIMREAARCAPMSQTPAAPEPERSLAVLFTSGTTGVPKGAILTRRAFVEAARASAANLGWNDDERWLLCMPLAHVGGLSILTRCVMARRCVVIPEGAGRGFDPDAIRETLDRDRVTICSFVPTMLARLIEPALNWRVPPTLRAVLLGGAATPARLLDVARERAIPAMTTYGLTEGCSQVTTTRYGSVPSPDLGSGEPLLGTEVRIAGGRIEIRSPSLFAGYFPIGAGPHPFSRDGWFRTEDYGRIDERGRLHVLGRTAELIVTGGENVYPAEIERELERISGVQSCCVFGVDDDRWGQLVCAALVCDSTEASVRARLAEVCAKSLAPHKRPRRVAFMERLTTTAAGKLDRAAIARDASPRLTRVSEP